MNSIRLTIQTRARTLFYPAEDDALGHRLMGLLLERLRPPRTENAARRPPRPALFLFSADVVRIIDLLPLLQVGGDVHRAISSFAALDGVEAIALVGILDRRRASDLPASDRRAVERVAACFIEWADGRWWLGNSALDGQLQSVTEAVAVDRAVDRAPRPGGLGNWFSRARFQQLRIRLQPVVEEMVH